jgi:hypothetical protein
MDILQTLIGGLVGGGLIGFIEFLIRRSDNKADKHDEVLARLDAIDDKMGDIEYQLKANKADDARNRILMFDDEIRRSIQHSEESYNQILESINFYNKFCHENPQYENSKAVNAIANINKVYQQVKFEDRFI